MGKAIPLLVAGTGGTVVAAGGNFLLQRSGGSTTDGAGAAPSQPSTSQIQTQELTLEFEDLNSFIKAPTKSPCVKDYFPTLGNQNNAKEINTTEKPTDNEFFTTPSDGSEIKSCLKIEYKKTTYSADKWSGKFTWLWTFMSGDEGFVTFNVAETSDKVDAKLKFTGVFYLVGKKDGDNKWEVKYKKEVGGDDKKAHDTTTFSQYFPKASDTLQTPAGGEYWGFLESGDKLDKICKTGECAVGGTPSTPFKKEFTWTKGTDDSKKLGGWSKDLTWWSNIYDSSSTNWNLSDKITSFNGEWSLKSQTTQ